MQEYVANSRVLSFRLFATMAAALAFTVISGPAHASDKRASTSQRTLLDEEFEKREGFSPFTKMEAFTIACEAGRRDACERKQELGWGEWFTNARAHDFLNFACRKEDAKACYTTGLWFEYGLGKKRNRGRAEYGYKKACAEGFAPGCRGLARVQKDDTPERLNEKLELYDQACEMGSSAACSDHSLLLLARRPKGDELLASLGRASASCEASGPLTDCEFAAGFASAMMTGTLPESAERTWLATLGEKAKARIGEALPAHISAADTPARIEALARLRDEAGVALATPENIAMAGDRPALLEVVLHGVGAGDPLGAEALIAAAKAGQLDTVELLLARGVNVNVVDDEGQTALFHAANKNHAVLIDMLIAKGVKINAPSTIGGTALMAASAAGNTAAVNSLLAAGAKPDLATQSGATALHLAAQRGNAKVVALLLRGGANPDVLLTESGSSPLAVASAAGDGQTVSVLLQMGADPNVAEKNGDTALFHAIRAGHDGIAKLLLDGGASPKVVNDAGETPSQLFAQIREQRAALKAQQEREALLAQQRAAEQRRLALAEAEAKKKKKGGGGLLGGLLGAVGGAVIGSDLGLNASEISQLSTAMAGIGSAAEQADSMDPGQGILKVLGASAGLAAGAAGDTGLASALGGGGGGGGIGSVLGEAMGSGDMGLEGALVAGAVAGLIASETDDPSVTQGLGAALARQGLPANSSGNSGAADLNQRTRASASAEGYSTYEHSYTCPSGASNTISVPYKTERQKQLRIRLAETAGCNRMQEAEQVMNQCRAEFGNPYCQ